MYQELNQLNLYQIKLVFKSCNEGKIREHVSTEKEILLQDDFFSYWSTFYQMVF